MRNNSKDEPKDPKVSVIIPTFNSSNYICEAIESVLNQSFINFEIIVVDDGSTDSTKRAITKYNGIVRYIFQDNSGEGSARNRGIREARGEYVAFLDADDIWMSTKLEKQMKLIDSLEDKDIVVYGDGYTFNETGIIIKSMFGERKPHSGYVYDQLLYKNFVVTQTVITKRYFFDKVGYFKEGMKYCEDFEMWLRLAKNYKFYYVNDVIAGYRIHSKQVSGNIHKMCDCHLIVVNDTLNNIKDNKNLVNDVLAKQHLNYGNNFWQNNFIKDARTEFWLSLKHGLAGKTFLYFLITFLPSFFVKKIRLLKSRLK